MIIIFEPKYLSDEAENRPDTKDSSMTRMGK